MKNAGILMVTLYLLSGRSSASDGVPCSDPGALTNGGRSPPIANSPQILPSGTKLHFHCEPGYALQGSEKMVCNHDGQWEPTTKPSCDLILVICPDPIIAHGSAIGGPSGAYTPGQTTSIICQRGYRMVSHDGRYSPYGGRIVCREDGLWLTETGSTFLPRCELKPCEQPTAVPNGGYTLYYPSSSGKASTGGSTGVTRAQIVDGSRALYYCAKGYAPEKNYKYELTCRDGEWSGTLPNCVKKSCDPPLDIENGNWFILGATHFDYGVHTKVMYECNKGYKLRGKDQLECQPDGYWSSGSPKCIHSDEDTGICLRLPDPEHGYHVCKAEKGCHQSDTHYHVGVQLYFSCYETYEPSGTHSLTCQEGGMWSSQPPTCVKVNPTSPSQAIIVAAPITIVIATAGSVLGVLLLVMIIVAFQRRKSSTRLCHPVQPPPTPPYTPRPRSDSIDEHDRLALIAFADGVQVVLPSYEEAIRQSTTPTPSLRSETRSLQYRPLPSIPPSMRHHGAGAQLREMPPESCRNSTITVTSTNTRDNMSENFGSIDTVNVSDVTSINVSDGTSTTVTIGTYDSGASNPSLAASHRAVAGSIGSSNTSLANEDAPLLDHANNNNPINNNNSENRNTAVEIPSPDDQHKDD